MIDSKFKPLLLEVNCSPSFGTDSSLDYLIKKNVIGDAFKLLNFSYKKRKELVKQRRDKIETRIRTGKTLKMTPMEREKLRQQKLQERFKFEAERMAGYELIFPCGDRSRTTNYETLLKKSHEIWDDFNLGKTKNKTRMMNEAIKAKVTHMMKMTSGI
jgi:putative sterol carrier protein